MCMLYGFNANKRFDLRNSMKEFFTYSNRHPHGWGLGIYDKEESPTLMKESNTAYKSELVKSITNGRLPGRMAIGHIRYATMGDKINTNTHPFVRYFNNKEWVFAHNGSIDIEDINTQLYIRPWGETDSELIFCYIIQSLMESEKSDIETIEKSVINISKYGKLNLLFTDGEYLYVHTNYENSLYVYEKEGMACFSTKPLKNTIDVSKWTNAPLNRLLVYKNGQLYYEGEVHGNQYYRTSRIDYTEGRIN